MASQANAAMWDELRAYAMGGAKGNITEARAQRAFRVARMVESRAAAESAQERLAQLREQRADAQADRQEQRSQREARANEAAQTRLARQQAEATRAARNQRVMTARGISRFAASHAPGPAQRAGARLRSLPTPGGLGGVIAALLFFNVAIVPVGTSGQTRLLLLWQVLTGAVALPTPPAPPSAASATDQQAVNDVAASTAIQVASGGAFIIPPALIPPILQDIGAFLP